MSLTACGNKMEDPVTIDNVNQSSVNVAIGFFQSIFTGDEELFEACYPDYFKEYENDDGETFDMQELFDRYVEASDTSYTYLGAALSAYNDYDEAHGYDFPALQANIAMIQHTPLIDTATAAQIVKLRLNFQSDGGDRMTTDVYILVYKTDTAWYVFELQNSDAEFAA